MSIEIAIQNLADAINNLAESNRPQTRTEDRQPLTGAEKANVEGSASAHATQKTPSIVDAAKPTDAKSAVAEAKAKAEAAKVQAEASKVAAELEADVPTPSYETDVRPALTKYMQSKGKPAGLALMAKYGAKNGTEIKAADYAALLADIAAG